jgi:hypothetical protein
VAVPPSKAARDTLRRYASMSQRAFSSAALVISWPRMTCSGEFLSRADICSQSERHDEVAENAPGCICRFAVVKRPFELSPCEDIHASELGRRPQWGCRSMDSMRASTFRLWFLFATLYNAQL